MKKLGLQAKLTIIFIAVSVFVLTITTYFVYKRAVFQQKEQLRKKILTLVQLSSMLIDGDKLIGIEPVLASQGTDTYKEIKTVLSKIRNSDTVIDSVYTMVESNKENILLFLVDSGDRRKAMAYCGERFDISSFPAMQEAFKKPSVDKEIAEDRWGTFLSGYAPIYKKSGQVAAIVGIDVTAESIRNMQLLLAKRFFWVLVLGILLSLFLGRVVAIGITRPLVNLIEGAREVAKGNLKYKVIVKSRDELGELADAFNGMTKSLLEAENKLQRLYLSAIQSLAYALEAKDRYTKGHSERVSRYAVNIAKQLDLPEEKVKLLEDLCVLHDIGKIGIPEDILVKPGILTDKEKEILHKHPEIGKNILKNIEFLKSGLSIISDHHERPDGKGYPRGLKSDSISELASIVAVADAFDAMTSDRPYRKAMNKEEAIKSLKENEGSQFVLRAVEAFVIYLNNNPEDLPLD